MAVEKFYNAVVTIDGTGGPPPTGGTALPHVHAVTIDYTAEPLDVSQMGDTTKSNIAGLLDWTITVELFQDWAAGNVDAILFPKIGAAPFYIQVKKDAGAVSATNPQYYATCMLETYNPMSGAVGEAILVSAAFRPAPTSPGLVRSAT